MKNTKETKRNITSACNVVSLQSNGADIIRESDLIIDLSGDVRSCDHSDDDINKLVLPSEFDFEQDIEKLIEVSKQFQTDYENDKARKVSDDVVDDLNIPILSANSNSLRRQKTSAAEENRLVNDVDNYYFSNIISSRKENVFGLRSSQRNKTFTPKSINRVPFGTGIVRPSPKKHSCIPRSELLPVKRSYRSLNIRPYTARYYNFDRTHPALKLVDDGDSMIPKRIPNEPTEMAGKANAGGATKKPLLNEGLTWHEFFERSNVYSAKSLQSSHDDTSTKRSSDSQVLSPKLTEVNKIEKHVLPPLNIRAECCVQRIPEISIAPNGLRQTVTSNIKLVEIIYEESHSTLHDIAEPLKQNIEKENEIERQQLRRSVESMEINESSKFSESKMSLTTSTKTSSENDEYDSSLDDSISLPVSRVSALTSAFIDHQTIGKKQPLKDTGVQTVQMHKLKRFAKHRADNNGHNTVMTSSDCSDFEYDGKCYTTPVSLLSSSLSSNIFIYLTGNLRQPQFSHDVKLPTFPTNELIQMVDEIFDTSSDAVMSCKYFRKETSVQTDIVWENINDLFKQQCATNEPLNACAMENSFPAEIYDHRPQVTGCLPLNSVNASERIPVRMPTGATSYQDANCRHAHMKRFKICSCLQCNTNIRFSAMNINRSSSGSSSSSSAIDHTSKPSPAAKMKLFPSERYKQMKQAQREHFENDPRISKTLKKIYATAKTFQWRNETTSSSSGQFNVPLRFGTFPSYDNNGDDDALQPDLYTFSDEVLLFGCSSDEIQYSSHLLTTESSQDTFTSNVRHCAMSNDMRRKLMCTNSEESSGNSLFSRRESDLERCLMKDIENSGSDPTALSSVFSTSSLERKVNEIQLDDRVKCN